MNHLQTRYSTMVQGAMGEITAKSAQFHTDREEK